MARRQFADLKSYVDAIYREKLGKQVEVGNISTETARTYLSAVKQVADQLQDRGIHSFRDAKAGEKIQAIFHEWRQTKEFQDRTFNRMLAAVRHFSKTCLPGRHRLAGDIKANRVANDAHRRGHSIQEKKQLDRAATKLKGKARLAYLAAKGAGLRYGEITRLSADHVFQRDGQLHIHVTEQKWGGERIAPVACLTTREQNELKDLVNQHLSQASMGEWVVDQAMKTIGGIHAYRHDFAHDKF
jgi:site-specific recombinase XerD